MLPRLRPDDPLHRKAHIDEVVIRGGVNGLERVEQRRATVPRHLLARMHDVVTHQGADRNEADVGHTQARRPSAQFLLQTKEDLLGVGDAVHLVDGEDEVPHAEERRDERMPAALLAHALGGVHEHDREVRGARTRDHIPRVLDVPRRVRQDEGSTGCGEVSIRDIDGDALLALRAEPVGQERQIGPLISSARAHLGDVLELVLVCAPRVEEEPTEKRRLAVIDTPRGDEAQQVSSCRWLGHQKYPSRFRSSIAASPARSSARAAPRSVIRAVSTSSTT